VKIKPEVRYTQPRLLQRLLNESILSAMSQRRKILWSDLQFKNFNLQWHIWAKRVYDCYGYSQQRLVMILSVNLSDENFNFQLHKQREGCDVDRSIRVIYSYSIFLSWFCCWRFSNVYLVNNYNLQCIKLWNNDDALDLQANYETLLQKNNIINESS